MTLTFCGRHNTSEMFMRIVGGRRSTVDVGCLQIEINLSCCIKWGQSSKFKRRILQQRGHLQAKKLGEDSVRHLIWMQASLNQMNSCNCGVFFAANNLEAHANGKNEKCAGTQHGKAQTSWQVQYIVRVSFFRFPQWHCCGAVLNLDSFFVVGMSSPWALHQSSSEHSQGDNHKPCP